VIYSFVNLVSWQHFITPARNEVDRKIFFDSMSINLLAFLVTGKRIHLYSGVDYFLNQVKNAETDCFLVANKSVRFENLFVLPQFNGMCEDELNNVDWTFINSFKKVYIGISSPKQEKLAEFLQKKYGMVDYFCLGAALYVKPEEFRNSKLKFLVFLKKDYRRSITKIKATLVQILRIVFLSKIREEFREFVLKETDYS
jgi:hypothetical protein